MRPFASLLCPRFVTSCLDGGKTKRGVCGILFAVMEMRDAAVVDGMPSTYLLTGLYVLLRLTQILAMNMVEIGSLQDVD